jgi:hypothetical protein
MVNKLFFILLFITLVRSSFAQEITATASTDTTDYLIGDQIKYSLVIKMSNDVFIINPFFRDTLKNIDVVSIDGPNIEESGQQKVVKYLTVLSRFDSATITIPSIRIEYRTKNDTTLKSIESNSVTFNVHRMDVSVEEEIKDIKPPIRLFDYFFLIYILVGLIILSILVYYFIWRKYFRSKKEIIVVKKEEKLLSHQLALKQLEQLEKEQLWQKGLVKEYHSRITEIIREYFEKQFGLPALERTTSESLQLLKQHHQGLKVLDITGQFLNNADLVKFAKYIPMETVNVDMMNQAKSIVKKTAGLDQSEKKEKVNVH